MPVAYAHCLCPLPMQSAPPSATAASCQPPLAPTGAILPVPSLPAGLGAAIQRLGTMLAAPDCQAAGAARNGGRSYAIRPRGSWYGMPWQCGPWSQQLYGRYDCGKVIEANVRSHADERPGRLHNAAEPKRLFPRRGTGQFRLRPAAERPRDTRLRQRLRPRRTRCRWHRRQRRLKVSVPCQPIKPTHLGRYLSWSCILGCRTS